MKQYTTAFKARVRQIPITLQRTEIVGVADLLAQRLENRPVAHGAVDAERVLEMCAQIKNHAVVIEQRVVDVEQKHYIGRHDSGAMSGTRILCDASDAGLCDACVCFGYSTPSPELPYFVPGSC